MTGASRKGMQTLARTCAATILAILLCTALDVTAQRTPEPLVPEVARIPLPGGTTMAAQVFRPPEGGPFPVLVFSHGRAGADCERRSLANPAPHGHARFWMGRGYAVVAPIRPGYGITGGPDRENSGARYDEWGRCISSPEPQRTAGPAAETIASAVAWVRAQPWARSDRILLSGNSVGGLATIAACSASLPGVVGCINFAGGSGGSPASNGQMCEPQRIEALMAGRGQANRLPSIWLYAPNDLFWGAEAPKRWHAAFAAGGSPARFIGTEPVPAPDGHGLLRVGGKLWSVPLQAWLVEQGFSSSGISSGVSGGVSGAGRV